MGGGYQPMETWAVMMEDRCAKALVRNRKPPRPEYTLLEGPCHCSCAVHMQQHIVMDSWKSLLVPERADQKCSEK